MSDPLARFPRVRLRRHPLIEIGLLMTAPSRSPRRVSAASRGVFSRATTWMPLAALAAVLLVMSGAPVAASAATGADVSWTMRPATDGAQDERSWVELDLDPGERRQEEAALTNLSAEAVTFRITAADGYFTDTGRFNMLPSSETSSGAGTWIEVSDQVTVQPRATAIIPFTVTVPEDAEPGDHAAGIAASVTSVGTDSGGASLGVESRIGFRVMTRVRGDVVPAVAVEAVTSTYLLSWNPLRPGSVTVNAEVVNTGNVRVTLEGTAIAQGGSAPLRPDGSPTQELLPGDRRAVSTVVDNVWPLFAVPIELSVTPTVVSPTNDPMEVAPISLASSVVAVPAPQLLVLLGAGLVLAAVFAGRARSRRRVEALVREAREEGLREATRAAS